MEAEGAEKNRGLGTLEHCGKWETSHPEEVGATEDGNLVTISERVHCEQGRVKEVELSCLVFLRYGVKVMADTDICLFW